jgi:hypothetical protein
VGLAHQRPAAAPWLPGPPLISTQDSNLFVTASTAYALLLFDDTGLAEGDRFVSGMLHRVLTTVQGFKRNEAYNFWPVLPGVDSPLPRTGPLNVPVAKIRRQARFYLSGPGRVLLAPLTCGLRMPPRRWVAACLDRRRNPTGADALLNTPNDADDTALALALQRFYARRFPGCGPEPDLPALVQVARYRDLGRAREDGRDAWKGKDTGAFLTWMKEEAEPVFGCPQTGVMPLGVNNVDAVVNANVAFALAANGCKGLPGYDDCLRLLARVVQHHLWPEAGIYYPASVIFPYAASRAYRDGGAREGPMRPAMGQLLQQLLDEQVAWGRRHPRHRGAFPGGEDPSDQLATALGLSALLNLGRPLACEAGLAGRFDRGVREAVAYLIRVRRRRRLVYPSPLECGGQGLRHAAVRESGLFFSTGTDLAWWRSQAFTVAMVLEALTKYAVAYDLDGCALGGRRLALVPRPGGAAGLGLAVVEESSPSLEAPCRNRRPGATRTRKSPSQPRSRAERFIFRADVQTVQDEPHPYPCKTYVPGASPSGG